VPPPISRANASPGAGEAGQQAVLCERAVYWETGRASDSDSGSDSEKAPLPAAAPAPAPQDEEEEEAKEYPKDRSASMGASTTAAVE
jgi:hypothetical protein